jgi:hypothetical protein
MSQIHTDLRIRMDEKLMLFVKDTRDLYDMADLSILDYAHDLFATSLNLLANVAILLECDQETVIDLLNKSMQFKKGQIDGEKYTATTHHRSR